MCRSNQPLSIQGNISSPSIPEGLPHDADGAAAGGVPLGDDFLHVEGCLHREEHHLGQEEGEVEPGLNGTHGLGDLVKDLKRSLQEDTTIHHPRSKITQPHLYSVEDKVDNSKYYLMHQSDAPHAHIVTHDVQLTQSGHHTLSSPSLAEKIRS